MVCGAFTPPNSYKTTDYYAPQFEAAIRWNDPDIGINSLEGEQRFQPEDAVAMSLAITSEIVLRM